MAQSPAPAPRDERSVEDPFTPYEIGAPAAAWTYEHLSTAEQRVVDRGRDPGTWAAAHDAYGTAGTELAAKAAAEAAAMKRDGGHLGAIGGVP